MAISGEHNMARAFDQLRYAYEKFDITGQAALKTATKLIMELILEFDKNGQIKECIAKPKSDRSGILSELIRGYKGK